MKNKKGTMSIFLLILNQFYAVHFNFGWGFSSVKIMIQNLNSFFALPTLIATFASSGLQVEAEVLGRSSNHELYHDKGPQ
jgi:hypothetical protein